MLAALVAAGCSTPGTTRGGETGEDLIRASDAVALCSGVAQADLEPGFGSLVVTRAVVLERAYGYGGFVVEGVALRVVLEGRTLEELRRLVRCRSARARAASDRCDPLGVLGSRVRVLPDGEEAAIVQLRSRGIQTAKEVLARVRAIREVVDLRVEYGDDSSPAGTSAGRGAAHGGTSVPVPLRPPRPPVR